MFESLTALNRIMSVWSQNDINILNTEWVPLWLQRDHNVFDIIVIVLTHILCPFMKYKPNNSHILFKLASFHIYILSNLPTCVIHSNECVFVCVCTQMYYQVKYCPIAMWPAWWEIDKNTLVSLIFILVVMSNGFFFNFFNFIYSMYNT